jgi:hypothetical protein
MVTGQCLGAKMEWIIDRWVTIMDVGWTAQATIEEWVVVGAITTAVTAVIAAPSGIIITRSAAATDADDRLRQKELNDPVRRSFSCWKRATPLARISLNFGPVDEHSSGGVSFWRGCEPPLRNQPSIL